MIAGVNFRPQSPGEWDFAVSFVAGTGAAITASNATGILPVSGLHGLGGSFRVAPTDKHGPDLRAKGMLRYVGTRYLRHDNGEYYVKAGTDSPENVRPRGFLLFDWFPTEGLPFPSPFTLI